MISVHSPLLAYLLLSLHSPVTSGCWSKSFWEWRTSGTTLWLQLTKAGLSMGTTSTKCTGLGGSLTETGILGCCAGAGGGSGSWGACGCSSGNMGCGDAAFATGCTSIVSCFSAECDGTTIRMWQRYGGFCSINCRQIDFPIQSTGMREKKKGPQPCIPMPNAPYPPT